MNILIATGIYPPEAGGPATYSYELAKALKRKGHEVIVVSYGEGEAVDPTQKDGVEVRWVSRRGGTVLRYARYAQTLYSLKRWTDVIFAQGAVSEGVPATLISKWIGKPLVMRIPGDYAWEMGMQIAAHETEDSLDRFLTRTHSGRIGWYERFERWTARQAFLVITPSRYLKSVVERWGVPKERLHVIKNTTQLLPSTQGRERLRRREEVEDAVVCLTAVRAVRWKGVGELVEWWHRLPASHLLVVAGDGPLLEEWKSKAQAEGVADRIRFVGRLDRAALTEWYDMADVFVLHTGYEGYPHTVPEAVSRGLSCLVSNQGGNPETVEDFGERVTVLPYQDREAWVEALARVQKRSRGGALVPDGAHQGMVEEVEKKLLTAVDPAQAFSQVVMVGYERELVKTESDTFQRVSRLAGDGMRISAFVIARLPEDVAVERDGLRVEGFTGSAIRRVIQTIYKGIKEANRLPGRVVISGQDPFAAGLVAYLISRLTNHPLELQEHGDFWSGAWERERLLNRAWSWLGMHLLRRAEGVRVVSERVKEHLIAHGVAAEGIAIIPVAKDIQSLVEIPLSMQKKGEWIIRVPCRFVPQKGVDILLGAFALVHERHLNARLELMGAGPEEYAIQQKIRSLGLASVVEMYSWNSSSELWSGADLFVMSSWYEGFGRTLIEAAAAGVSIVSTDVGCVGSYLVHDKEILVVPVGDVSALASAMNQIIEDESLRERLRIAAREKMRTIPKANELIERQQNHWFQMRQKSQGSQMGTRFEIWVWVFLLYALSTRVASVVLFHKQLLSREWGFFTLVQNWLHGYGYSFAPALGCASAYRSPGYLFFLTGLYSVFDPSNTWAQAIIQNIVVVGALWLTYVVGKRLVGPKAALLGAFIMASYPYTFYHYTQYYHTFLQSFFLLLVVWCVLRLTETRRLSYAVASGVAIGMLAYVQGTILPITPFIALWVIWRLWSDKPRAIGAVLLIALFSAGVIAPWTYRNWNVTGHFIPLTTDLGHALIKANNENIYELTKRGYPQEIIEDVPSSTNPLYKRYRLPVSVETELQQAGVLRESILFNEWHPKEPVAGLQQCSDRGLLDEYAFNRYWTEKARQQWHDHWGWEMWRLPLQKIYTFWKPGLFPYVKTGAPWSFAGSAWKEWAARNSVLLSTGVVILFGLIGWGVQLKKRQSYALLTGSFFLVFTLLHALVAGYTKYRIPLDHLLAPYAAWSVLRGWNWLRGKRL